jgi:AcrR family transcriptional regulator
MKPARRVVEKRRERAVKKAPPASARTRLEVDERREQLVKLGLDLFSARAYDEVSIVELARAAGISKGLLYHYFPTKRDFYVATVRAAAQLLLDRTVTPDDMPVVERLRAGLDAYFDYVEAHAASYAALLRGGIGADPEVTRIIEETRETFCDRLLEGAHLASPGPLVRTALRAWVGFVEAASLEWIERRAVPRAALRDLVLQVLQSAVTLAATAEGTNA